MDKKQQTMRANVKPLTHWIIYRGYTVRFLTRTAAAVSGLLTTPDGELPFDYDPAGMVVRLPAATVRINAHGWELERTPAESEEPPGTAPGESDL